MTDHERQLDLAEEDYLRDRATNEGSEGSNKGPNIVTHSFCYSLTPDEWKLLEDSAKAQGELPEVLIWHLIATEITRLKHIERCRPKPEGPKRPVGRPRLSDRKKAIRQLSKRLEKIFRRLAEISTVEVFRKRYFNLDEHWWKLVAEDKLEELQKFYDDQPWTKEG